MKTGVETCQLRSNDSSSFETPNRRRRPAVVWSTALAVLAGLILLVAAPHTAGAGIVVDELKPAPPKSDRPGGPEKPRPPAGITMCGGKAPGGNDKVPSEGSLGTFGENPLTRQGGATLPLSGKPNANLGAMVSARADSRFRILVTWKPLPGPQPSRYHVYRCASPTSCALAGSVPGATLRFVDGGCPSLACSYRVVAEYGLGNAAGLGQVAYPLLSRVDVSAVGGCSALPAPAGLPLLGVLLLLPFALLRRGRSGPSR